MAELVVTLKGREIQRFPITQRVTNIGRSQNSDLSLSNESVSRDHARLSYVNRTFFIERVTEHNLVLLNETECVAPMPVEDGTRIQIGKYTIVLHKMGGPSLGLIDGDSFSSMGSTEVLSTHDINRYAQSLDEPEPPRSLEQIRLGKVQSLQRVNTLLKLVIIFSLALNIYLLSR